MTTINYWNRTLHSKLRQTKERIVEKLSIHRKDQLSNVLKFDIVTKAMLHFKVKVHNYHSL